MDDLLLSEVEKGIFSFGSIDRTRLMHRTRVFDGIEFYSPPKYSRKRILLSIYTSGWAQEYLTPACAAKWMTTSNFLVAPKRNPSTSFFSVKINWINSKIRDCSPKIIFYQSGYPQGLMPSQLSGIF